MNPAVFAYVLSLHPQYLQADGKPCSGYALCLALAHLAEADGVIDQPVAVLAAVAGLGVSTVQKWSAILQAQGVLCVVPQADPQTGSPRPNLYYFPALGVPARCRFHANETAQSDQARRQATCTAQLQTIQRQAVDLDRKTRYITFLEQRVPA